MQSLMESAVSIQLTSGIHIHVVGIGGAGMSAIARVLLGRGFRVSGSDKQSNTQTAALAAEGVTVYIGHAAEHIDGADMVVISSAVPPTNPEWVAAEARVLKSSRPCVGVSARKKVVPPATTKSLGLLSLLPG